MLDKYIIILYNNSIQGNKTLKTYNARNARKELKNMFVKIERTDLNGGQKETIVNTDTIISVLEKDPKTTELYDADGNVVETRVGGKRFVVICKGGITLKIDETNYNELVKALGL